MAVTAATGPRRAATAWRRATRHTTTRERPGSPRRRPLHQWRVLAQKAMTGGAGAMAVAAVRLLLLSRFPISVYFIQNDEV
jgi:hypothetical protein